MHALPRTLLFVPGKANNRELPSLAAERQESLPRRPAVTQQKLARVGTAAAVVRFRLPSEAAYTARRRGAVRRQDGSGGVKADVAVAVAGWISMAPSSLVSTAQAARVRLWFKYCGLESRLNNANLIFTNSLLHFCVRFVQSSQRRDVVKQANDGARRLRGKVLTSNAVAFFFALALDKTTHIAREGAHLPHLMAFLLETLVAHTCSREGGPAVCRTLRGLLWVPQYRATSVYELVCRRCSQIIRGC